MKNTPNKEDPSYQLDFHRINNEYYIKVTNFDDYLKFLIKTTSHRSTPILKAIQTVLSDALSNFKAEIELKKSSKTPWYKRIF